MSCGCNKRNVRNRINISINLVNECSEAVAMLAMYTLKGVTLVGIEKQSMIDYVCAEVKSGNHYKKDNETIYSLQGVNSLVDYIGGKISSLINAPSWSINGYTFDGISNYINSNFNPKFNGVNYTQFNGLAASFLHNTARLGNLETLFASIDSSGFNTGTHIRQSSSPNINFGCNTSNSTSFGSQPFKNKTLYLVGRNSTSYQQCYINGTLLINTLRNSTEISNHKFRIASSENVRFFKGTVSNFMACASIGFHKSNYYINLRKLLTDLGSLP